MQVQSFVIYVYLSKFTDILQGTWKLFEKYDSTLTVDICSCFIESSLVIASSLKLGAEMQSMVYE